MVEIMVIAEIAIEGMTQGQIILVITVAVTEKGMIDQGNLIGGHW